MMIRRSEGKGRGKRCGVAVCRIFLRMGGNGKGRDYGSAICRVHEDTFELKDISASELLV